jgi:hypothetical protein
MVDAEFTAELLIMMMLGIKDKTKRIIDKAFAEYDDQLPNRAALIKHFRETMDTIGALLMDTSESSSFRRSPLFYTQ